MLTYFTAREKKRRKHEIRLLTAYYLLTTSLSLNQYNK